MPRTPPATSKLRAAGAVTLLLLAASAAGSGLAEPLCANRDRRGALVFTNETAEGHCDRVVVRDPVRQPRPSLALPRSIDRNLTRYSRMHDVPERLVRAVVQVESAGNPAAVSPKGAMGLMQLMPETARRFGVTDPMNADESLQGGIRYLAHLLERYDGDTTLALAAYNAGEGAVDDHGGVPPYRETREYVRKVLRLAGGKAPGVAGGARSAPRAPAVRLRQGPGGGVLLEN